jgi:DNA-directed RNA polymerase subunit K/omega
MSDNGEYEYDDADVSPTGSDAESEGENSPKIVGEEVEEVEDVEDVSDAGSEQDDSEVDDSEPEEDDEDDDMPGLNNADEEQPEDVDNEGPIDFGSDAEEETVKKIRKSRKKANKSSIIPIHDDDDDDDDDYENYLQKFDSDTMRNYLVDQHSECFTHNYDEIEKLSVVVRNEDNIVVDPLHRTIPILTKYERARILGQRTKQIETGATPLVKVPETIVDAYIIAELELKEKRIPFIIRRPKPDGSCEYWPVSELENIM